MTDMPVPRRSMSQPLRERVSQEEVVAAPAPAPVTVAPVAAVATAPAPRPEPQYIEEPSLFDEADNEQVYDEVAQTDDDLPPPAYKPRPEPAMEASPEVFVAPRAPRPGTASPEAMARLTAAAQRNGHMAQPRAAQTPAPSVRTAEGERPRFGIGSLINRMSGGHTEAPQPSRQQPQVSTRPADTHAEVDPDQERIEIPAFLRRQAN